MVRFVCISDTHGLHDQLEIPPGDVLIHAGDFSKRGQPEEIILFNQWLGTLSHPTKIVIAGNHDFLFEREPEKARGLITHAYYMENSGLEVAGLHCWGSPITPRFFNWAFNRDRGEDIRRYWQQIPNQTDILITHGPPHGILDEVFPFKRHVGCEDLRQEIVRVQPKVVIFGHIHEAYGQLEQAGIHYVNASSLDRKYRPVHQPIIIDV